MVSLDYVKCVLQAWGDEERGGNSVDLGYPKCNQLGVWVKSGILPPTKHRPGEQNPMEEVIERVGKLWSVMNITVDVRAKRVIKVHYKFGDWIARDRYKKAKVNKTEYSPNTAQVAPNLPDAFEHKQTTAVPPNIRRRALTLEM
jgi:hypothetical protein